MSAEDLIRLIREDRIHGATDLAVIALEGIGSLPNVEPGLITKLKSLRPSMSAFEVLLTRLEARLGGGSVAGACDELIKEVRQAQQQVVEKMVSLIEPRDVLMTHSISSTIKRVLSELSTSAFDGKVVVTESRPGDEGKLLAAYLVDLGLSVIYITEAQIDLTMKDTDKVLLGADTVLIDGSIVNKSGSVLMALSAARHEVPLYVCAEEFKQVDSNEVELEEMDPAELGVDLDKVEVRNTYFEIVPADLIIRWVR